MEDLRYKTDEELMEIMRDSIDNQYVPSSIYHKVKQELDFRKSQEDESGEILKLSPEVHGVGVNLKSLWKWLRNHFPKGS